jgi:hypothetical protein
MRAAEQQSSGISKHHFILMHLLLVKAFFFTFNSDFPGTVTP